MRKNLRILGRARPLGSGLADATIPLTVERRARCSGRPRGVLACVEIKKLRQPRTLRGRGALKAAAGRWLEDRGNLLREPSSTSIPSESRANAE